MMHRSKAVRLAAATQFLVLLLTATNVFGQVPLSPSPPPSPPLSPPPSPPPNPNDSALGSAAGASPPPPSAAPSTVTARSKPAPSTDCTELQAGAFFLASWQDASLTFISGTSVHVPTLFGWRWIDKCFGALGYFPQNQKCGVDAASQFRCQDDRPVNFEVKWSSELIDGDSKLALYHDGTHTFTSTPQAAAEAKGSRVVRANATYVPLPKPASDSVTLVAGDGKTLVYTTEAASDAEAENKFYLKKGEMYCYLRKTDPEQPLLECNKASGWDPDQPPSSWTYENGLMGTPNGNGAKDTLVWQTNTGSLSVVSSAQSVTFLLIRTAELEALKTQSTTKLSPALVPSPSPSMRPPPASPSPPTAPVTAVLYSVTLQFSGVCDGTIDLANVAEKLENRTNEQISLKGLKGFTASIAPPACPDTANTTTANASYGRRLLQSTYDIDFVTTVTAVETAWRSQADLKALVRDWVNAIYTQEALNVNASKALLIKKNGDDVQVFAPPPAAARPPPSPQLPAPPPSPALVLNNTMAPPATPPPAPGGGGGGGINAGAVAGGVVGGVVLVAAIAGFVLYRRSQNPFREDDHIPIVKPESFEDNEDVITYIAGWSPEEMRSNMRAVEDATEALLALLRGNEELLAGPTARALQPLGVESLEDRMLWREAVKSSIYVWFNDMAWKQPGTNWLKKVDIASATRKTYRYLYNNYDTEVAVEDAPRLARHLAKDLGLIQSRSSLQSPDKMSEVMGEAAAGQLLEVVKAALLAFLHMKGCGVKHRISVSAAKPFRTGELKALAEGRHMARRTVERVPPFESILLPPGAGQVLLTCKPGVVLEARAAEAAHVAGIAVAEEVVATLKEKQLEPMV